MRPNLTLAAFSLWTPLENLGRICPMGLSVNGVRFLLYAKKVGVDFSRPALIGRQYLHLKPAELEASLVQFGFSYDPATITRVFAGGGYAEEFFRCLGAREIHSFDYSDYEKATHVHDLNKE